MSKIQKEKHELYSLLCAELTSVSDFIYASVLLAESCPALSSLAEAIAVSDLTHYRLLSHIARSQNIDPKIKFRVKSFWDGNDVSDFCSFFYHLANKKREAAEKFERLSRCKIFCHKCSNTLRSLAEDERSHCEMILSETDKIKYSSSGNNKI